MRRVEAGFYLTSLVAVSALAQPSQATAEGQENTDQVMVATTAEQLGTWGVQLAGNFSEEQAKAMFSRVQPDIADIIKGHAPTIIMTPLGNRGPQKIYRVRIQAMSRTEADELCLKIHTSGHNCVVLPSTR